MSIVKDTSVYRFGNFALDVANRELCREEDRLDLSARYFDALVLLVREHGRLVEKDRFFEEVWDDVVVSDSALTQAIKEIRRQLGDDAASPRFIQTVPRHGYRFIAEVSVTERGAGTDRQATNESEAVDRGGPQHESEAAEVEDPQVQAGDQGDLDIQRGPGSKGNLGSRRRSGTPADEASLQDAASHSDARSPGGMGAVSMSTEKGGSASFTGVAGRRESAYSAILATSLAGTLGGAVAGLLGGLLYGFGLAYSPIDQELGTASVLLVLVSLTGFLGTVGAFGISAGIAVAEYAAGGRSAWRIAGAVVGGMLVGGSVKLLGVDAFNLLFGRTPAGITGGMEGAALGLAVGLGAHVGGGFDTPSWWRPLAAAAATGAIIGVLIALSGGHLMGGSLDLLARSFTESRLQLDAIGNYFGEVRFGRTTQVVLAGIEGLIFTVCVVGALLASQKTRMHSSGEEPIH